MRQAVIHTKIRNIKRKVKPQIWVGNTSGKDEIRNPTQGTRLLETTKIKAVIHNPTNRIRFAEIIFRPQKEIDTVRAIHATDF